MGDNIFLDMLKFIPVRDGNQLLPDKITIIIVEIYPREGRKHVIMGERLARAVLDLSP